MYQKQGFTLIELLVVVLIIGILSAVALPQYTKAVAKTRMTNMIAATESLAKAEELYYLANGSYTADADDLDWNYQGSCVGVKTDAIKCKDYLMDLIEGALPSTNLFVKGHLCPGKADVWANCMDARDMTYAVWFEHSKNPGKRECEAYTALGRQLCAQFNK